MGSAATRAQLRTSWVAWTKNAASAAFQESLFALLKAKEVAVHAPLRARLGVPLGAGRTCQPWVEVVSANWLFEEPHPLPVHQVSAQQ